MAQHRIVQRGNTAATLATRNEILLEKELCFETDTGRYKLGDGITAWLDLPYFQLSAQLVGPLGMPSIENPSSPLEGNLWLYAQDIAGRLIPKWTGPGGIDTAVQAALSGNGIVIIAPGNGGVFTQIGGATPTVVGTTTHPVILSGINAKSTIRRALITSAAAANSAAVVRIILQLTYRGEVFGPFKAGGFYMTTRWGVSSNTALQRAYVGLRDTTAATSVTISPSAMTNCIICGWDSGDANLQIMSNDASGTCTKINLGSLFPANNINAIYETTFFCAPNGDEVGYRVLRIDTGDVIAGVIDTNLPSKSTMLSWHCYINNGGTAAAVAIDLMRMYMETDY